MSEALFGQIFDYLDRIGENAYFQKTVTVLICQFGKSRVSNWPQAPAD
jgi:hypothetical protein